MATFRGLLCEGGGYDGHYKHFGCAKQKGHDGFCVPRLCDSSVRAQSLGVPQEEAPMAEAEQPDGAMSPKSAEDKRATRASKHRASVAAEDNDDGAGCFPIATSANK